jgi:catechol 2,3-dioxygenase-like lactoylglutathione lyase family enzyme
VRLQGIDHIGIEVRYLDRAEEFYSGVLGLEVVNRFDNQVLFRGEGFNLALFRNQNMEPMGGGDVSKPFGKGHWAFTVDMEELKAARERFGKDGVPYHGPVDWDDHDCLYFLDPDGNLLEILAYR